MSYDEMKISKLGDACCGCGACAAKCPKTCISMHEDKFGFLHPVIDAGACVGCHACDSVCPALGGGKCDEALGIRWAKGKSSELLEASSSGGIFWPPSRKRDRGRRCCLRSRLGRRLPPCRACADRGRCLSRSCHALQVRPEPRRQGGLRGGFAMQSARVAVCSSLVPRARSRASSAIWERRGGAPFSSPLTLSATVSRRRAYGRSGLTTRMCSAIRTSVTLICGVRQPDGCLSPLCTST